MKILKGKFSPMEDALLETWEGQLENVADHAGDGKILFFVELVQADFKIDLKIGEENEKIRVIRWQFPLLHCLQCAMLDYPSGRSSTQKAPSLCSKTD